MFEAKFAWLKVAPNRVAGMVRLYDTTGPFPSILGNGVPSEYYNRTLLSEEKFDFVGPMTRAQVVSEVKNLMQIVNASNNLGYKTRDFYASL